MTFVQSERYAKSERAALSDLFDEVGPTAPTLCAGWDSADLAAHLWIRENDPIGVAGAVIKPLAGLYERRAAELQRRWPFPELVDRFRRGPGRLSLFALPGMEERANFTEFFVHHEDVRRAGEAPGLPRELGPQVENGMWRRLQLLSRILFRRARVGVVLERVGSPGGGVPETIRATAGTPIVTIVGRPSELVFFAYGRPHADVELLGEPEAIDLLHAADLGI